MKLISLNIWGGARFDELMAFVARASADTDLFCFQEAFDEPTHPAAVAFGARNNMPAVLAAALPEYVMLRPRSGAGRKVRFEIGREVFYHRAGLAIFVRQPLAIQAHGDALRTDDASARGKAALQWVTHKTARGSLTVFNFHGLVDLASGKRDSPLTLEQVHGVLEVMKQLPAPHVLVGDFNLRPETESIALFSQAGYRNVNAEFGVRLTRSSAYRDIETYRDYVSDYAFVSPDITVRSYRVLADVVSDHLPLRLEFDA